jgi:phosphoenolpyruvate carboxykinase (ATP)
MPLAHTRTLVHGVLDGTLAGAAFVPDPVFGIQVPTACPGVPARLLRPRDTWTDPSAYDARARQLAALFQTNFKAYASEVSEAVRQAGPRAG